MIRCVKCDNETRSSQLVTAQGEVLLGGTLSSDPQPILAQVCTACGYIELYAPQPTTRPEVARDSEEQLFGEISPTSVPQPAA
jgi:predicted nucleic-acid-binding Zn-ribbon protein